MFRRRVTRSVRGSHHQRSLSRSFIRDVKVERDLRARVKGPHISLFRAKCGPSQNVDGYLWQEVISFRQVMNNNVMLFDYAWMIIIIVTYLEFRLRRKN